MKKFLLSVSFILVLVFTAAASPAAINFDNLPKEEKFQAYFLILGMLLMQSAILILIIKKKKKTL